LLARTALLAGWPKAHARPADDELAGPSGNMGFGWGKQRNKPPGCHTDIVGIGVVGIAVVGTAAFGIAVAFPSRHPTNSLVH